MSSSTVPISRITQVITFIFFIIIVTKSPSASGTRQNEPHLQKINIDRKGPLIRKHKLKKKDLSSEFENNESNSNEEIKVIVKMKQKKTKKYSTISVLKNKIYMSIQSREIYAMTVTKQEYELLQNDPNCEQIELDGIVHVSNEEIPSGIETVLQKKISFFDSLEPKQVIKVCVVDTGYEISHEDLPSDVERVMGSNNTNVNEAWYYDGHGHGTHCAGVIGAIANNNLGVRGISSHENIQLVIGKGLGAAGTGSESSLLKAVESCISDHDANVISMSLGTPNYSSISSDFYMELYNDNRLLISAAGNSGNYDYSYPASYSSTISVAAVDHNEQHASFSQVNNQVEIAAPGVDVRSTSIGNSYQIWSGTSMSTPHVAGIAALLWSAFPECTNHQIRMALLATSTKDTTTCSNDVGYGTVQAKKAYDLLNDGACDSLFLDRVPQPKGGCQELSPNAYICTTDADCDDGNECTLNTCQTDGVCTTQISCEKCSSIALGQILIQPDNYGVETTWTLTNLETMEIIQQGGPYPESNIYTHEFCLQEGSFNFTIKDAFSDGICCEYGQGSFNVTVGGIEYIINGGDFQQQDSLHFDVVGSALQQATGTTTLTSTLTMPPDRGFDRAQSGTEVSISGSESPQSGSESPVSGSESPVSGSESPVSGSESPVSGSESPQSGTENPGSGSGTESPGSGSESPQSGTENPGSGSGTESPGSGSESPQSGTENPGSGSATNPPTSFISTFVSTAIEESTSSTKTPTRSPRTNSPTPVPTQIVVTSFPTINSVSSTNKPSKAPSTSKPKSFEESKKEMQETLKQMKRNRKKLIKDVEAGSPVDDNRLRQKDKERGADDTKKKNKKKKPKKPKKKASSNRNVSNDRKKTGNKTNKKKRKKDNSNSNNNDSLRKSIRNRGKLAKDSLKK